MIKQENRKFLSDQFVPNLFYQSSFALHLSFANGPSFYEDGTFRKRKMTELYKDVKYLYNFLFQEEDEIVLVSTTYPNTSNNLERPAICKRFLRQPHIKYRMSSRHSNWSYDGENYFYLSL